MKNYFCKAYSVIFSAFVKLFPYKTPLTLTTTPPTYSLPTPYLLPIYVLPTPTLSAAKP